MKKFFKKLGNFFLIVLLFIWKIFKSWTLGLFTLVVGTMVVFLMGFVLWLLGGYDSVNKYFDHLKPKL